MKEVMQFCVVIITVVVTIAVVIFAISYGWMQTESAECLKWQSEAVQFPGYYITRWQAEQCAANKIEVNAPVVER